MSTTAAVNIRDASSASTVDRRSSASSSFVLAPLRSFLTGLRAPTGPLPRGGPRTKTARKTHEANAPASHQKAAGGDRPRLLTGPALMGGCGNVGQGPLVARLGQTHDSALARNRVSTRTGACARHGSALPPLQGQLEPADVPPDADQLASLRRRTRATRAPRGTTTCWATCSGDWSSRPPWSRRTSV
jgi:hypothetical protein